ncbi:MAG TPA: hypothetical protein VFU97_24550 [Xanthobacteraceae bacterium]|nr:hypothetical protein [Xanthobacteraceae bacterium]
MTLDAASARAELERRAATPRWTLEQLLTDPRYFAVPTPSPLQRAVWRAIDGRPLGDLRWEPSVIRSFGGRLAWEAKTVDEIYRLAEHPDVVAAFAALPSVPPEEFWLIASVRGAKSLTAAALAFKASQTCVVDHLLPGEVPRLPVLSVQKDLAEAIMGHLVGHLTSKPDLRGFLLEEPTGDTVMLRHPSGRPIEVKITAGARAGATLTARWMIGAIFDEAPRMLGQEDGVVNLTDSQNAVRGRILPGGQIAYLGSPWAPYGPAYEAVQEHHGKPSEQVLVVRGKGYDLNPSWWTEERAEKLRKKDPDAHRTDVEAEFADPETALLSSIQLEAVTRKEPADLPRRPGREYVATMDPATRGNGWTFLIAEREYDWADPKNPRMKFIVTVAREWRGSKSEPLSPEKILGEEIAPLCREYGIDTIRGDMWSGDALRDIARRHGLELVLVHTDEATRWNRSKSFATRVEERLVELPPLPHLRTDLLNVRKRVTQDSVKIIYPKTSDGRHCDFAPPTILALALYVEPAVGEKPVDPQKSAKERLQEWRRQQAATVDEDDEREIKRQEKREFWEDD